MAMSLSSPSALIPGTAGTGESPLLSSCLTSLLGTCLASDTTGEVEEGSSWRVDASYITLKRQHA